MRSLLLSLCLLLGVASAQAAPDSAGVQVTLEIAGGSRIVGAPSADRIKIVTDDSRLEIELALLRTIELSGTSHAARLRFQNGDSLSGWLDAADIEVKAVFGQVRIPTSHLLRIRVTGNVKAPPMPEGLVLHYSFDTDEGGSVTDSSGAGNNGKVVGAIYTGEGKSGGAMSFNGNGQAVVAGNPASLQLQNFTIMAWVKRGSLTKASKLTTYGANGHFFGYGQGGYIFAMHPTGQLYLGRVGFEEVQSQFAIRDDSFHHAALTKQGSRVVFYLDGVASPATEYDGTFEFGTDAAVGAKADNMTGSFMGVIDEVCVFNRELSTDEIKGIYDSQK